MKLHRMAALIPVAILAAGLALIGAHAQSPGDTVYAKRANVTLKEGTSPSAADVAEVNQGTALTVLETSGPRLRVRTPDGTEGWVVKLQVTDAAPATGRRRSLLVDDLGPGERQDLSAVRGLSPTAEEYAAATQAPGQAIADARRMEQITESVTPGQVDTFLAEGGIKPQ